MKKFIFDVNNNRQSKEIEIMESVYARNNEIAGKTNAELTKKGVFVVNVMGAPGVGKTSSLLQIIPALDRSAFVIEGDIESDIDTKKLNDKNIKTVQINTGGACHLDSRLIAGTVSELDLESCYLFIENIGNLVCPAEFLIGEHVKLLISNVTEGSDKPYKYPLAFEKTDIILINKWDLLEYVNFDEAEFVEGVRKLNPAAPVFKVSGKTGEGYGEAVNWIIQKAGQIMKK